MKIKLIGGPGHGIEMEAKGEDIIAYFKESGEDFSWRYYRLEDTTLFIWERFHSNHQIRVMKWNLRAGRKLGEARFDDPNFKELSARLIAEEFAEAMSALTGEEVIVAVGAWTVEIIRPEEKPDPVQFLHELCDLRFVIEDRISELGWDGEGAFQAVADANDSKIPSDGRPVFRKDGKLLKGPDFKPADVSRFAR